MKAKLLIDGKEIEVNISEEEYKKIQPPKKKKTGYERVPEDNEYYYITEKGTVELGLEEQFCVDDAYYETANYYSSKIVAENNARADRLMRQLRRFAVEHRERGVNFNDINTKKNYICCDYEDNELRISLMFSSRVLGAIYFDSEETAQVAIDEFHDELIWYFTEYKDSL